MIIDKDAFDKVIGKKKAGNKYLNRKVTVGNITFDSKKEAERWQTLKCAESGGMIRNLQRQVWLKLEVNGVKVCSYVADFTYERHALGQKWTKVVEDVKSKFTKTLPLYRLKKKLVKACLDVEIVEV